MSSVDAELEEKRRIREERRKQREEELKKIEENDEKMRKDRELLRQLRRKKIEADETGVSLDQLLASQGLDELLAFSRSQSSDSTNSNLSTEKLEDTKKSASDAVSKANELLSLREQGKYSSGLASASSASSMSVEISDPTRSSTADLDRLRKMRDEERQKRKQELADRAKKEEEEREKLKQERLTLTAISGKEGSPRLASMRSLSGAGESGEASSGALLLQKYNSLKSEHVDQTAYLEKLRQKHNEAVKEIADLKAEIVSRDTKISEQDRFIEMQKEKIITLETEVTKLRVAEKMRKEEIQMEMARKSEQEKKAADEKRKRDEEERKRREDEKEAHRLRLEELKLLEAKLRREAELKNIELEQEKQRRLLAEKELLLREKEESRRREEEAFVNAQRSDKQRVQLLRVGSSKTPDKSKADSDGSVPPTPPADLAAPDAPPSLLSPKPVASSSSTIIFDDSIPADCDGVDTALGGGFFHSDQRLYADWYNATLGDDEHFKNEMPLDPDSPKFYSEVAKGVLPFKLFQRMIPDVEPVGSINFIVTDSNDKQENVEACIKSLEAAGSSTVSEISVSSVLKEKKEHLLALTWEIIRIPLVREMSQKKNQLSLLGMHPFDPRKEDVDKVLLKWCNFWLSKVGSSVVSNLNQSWRNPVKYLHLLEAIAPENEYVKDCRTRFGKKKSSQDRAQVVIETVEDLGAPCLVSAVGMIAGSSRQNWTLLASLFCWKETN